MFVKTHNSLWKNFFISGIFHFYSWISYFQKFITSFFTYCSIFDFEIAKKIIIVKLLDSENFAANSFNVYLTTSFGTNYHVNCLWNLSNSLIDFWLLTFDFRFTFIFYVYNFAQLILYSRPQGYHFSITKFTFCSINAKIYFWIISLFSF